MVAGTFFLALDSAVDCMRWHSFFGTNLVRSGWSDRGAVFRTLGDETLELLWGLLQSLQLAWLFETVWLRDVKSEFCVHLVLKELQIGIHSVFNRSRFFGVQAKG